VSYANDRTRDDHLRPCHKDTHLHSYDPLAIIDFTPFSLFSHKDQDLFM
jgi:hypothetical protein